jgi:poly-beta-1,6-N-acetyl-D-glucosamine synthase
MNLPATLNAKHSMAVIIPAFNEEKVIGASLEVLVKDIDPSHIYIVSDGSSDQTAAIARRYTPNVLNLRKNRGKAGALQQLIRNFRLTQHYHYLLFSDADSRLSPNFFEEISALVPQQPACIVGQVCSDRHGFISAMRTYEYGIGFGIIKQAQNILRVITVAPGCASLYKSEIIHKLNFLNHTLTEDYDLTLQIHLKKLGRIMYCPNAKVHTQDPLTLKDYWKQIVRWNTGFWQNHFMYRLYLPKSAISLELWLFVLDGLVWFSIPFLLFYYPNLFLILVISTYAVSTALALSVFVPRKAWWAIPYIPLFPLFNYVNIAAYYYSFFRALFSKGKNLTWNSVERQAIVSTPAPAPALIKQKISAPLGADKTVSHQRKESLV